MQTMELKVVIINDKAEPNDLDVVQDMAIIKRKVEELLEEYKESRYLSRFIISEVGQWVISESTYSDS